MKIILNAIQYKENGSGISKMIFHLYNALLECCSPKDEILILLSEDSPRFCYSRQNVTIERIPLKKGEVIQRNLFELFFIGNRYAQNAVYVSLDSKLPLRLPKSCRSVLLVTDMAVFRMPQVYQLSRAIYWRLMFWRSVRKADRLATISEFTRSEISKLLHIPVTQISVVPCAAGAVYHHLAVSQEKRRIVAKYTLPSRYILFVGNFNPRKNLERLLRAFDEYRSRQGTNDLVIAGEFGWKFNKEAALKGLLHREHIHFIGYVEEQDLPVVYSAADTFAFPTLYEGFGIPLIEAQNCGIPVLTSNVSALPEVGGIEGALYINPYNSSEMAEGLWLLETDTNLREMLIQNGYANCQRFSWEMSARQLYKEIRSCKVSHKDSLS